MGFQGVWFLSSPPGFYTIFLNSFYSIVFEVNASELPHINTVVVGRQGHASFKILWSNKSFLCQLHCMKIIRLSQSLGMYGHL